MQPKILLILLTLAAASCQRTFDDDISVQLDYFPHPYVIQGRPSAFSELSEAENSYDWGKELRIAIVFAKEQDYYRAITSFKRALILIPATDLSRNRQIQYAIIQCYYFAYKYEEAIETFEKSDLQYVSIEFPAFRDLLIILYDCYQKIDCPDKANSVLQLIQEHYPCEAENLELSTAFMDVNLSALSDFSERTFDEKNIQPFLFDYSLAAKSPERARLYQTLLPGAGYYYVGQKSTAVTSFLLNTLFIWAAYTFFKNGNTAAGLLTTSLETGWYFGGINGAGIAAREYNERLYEVNAREIMRQRGLFPILMIQTSF